MENRSRGTIPALMDSPFRRTSYPCCPSERRTCLVCVWIIAHRNGISRRIGAMDSCGSRSPFVRGFVSGNATWQCSLSRFLAFTFLPSFDGFGAADEGCLLKCILYIEQLERWTVTRRDGQRACKVLGKLVLCFFCYYIVFVINNARFLSNASRCQKMEI